MYVVFACPECGQPDRVNAAERTDWQCSQCEHRLEIAAADKNVSSCTICGNTEIYKKKDFPHSLGMALLVGACVLSVITYGLYEKWWTWAILIGTAIVDGALYLWVGDALVCYRCGAHYKGFQPGGSHKPFELTIGERYRQERIRREQLRKTESKS